MRMNFSIPFYFIIVIIIIGIKFHFCTSWHIRGIKQKFILAWRVVNCKFKEKKIRKNGTRFNILIKFKTFNKDIMNYVVGKKLIN